MNSIPDFSKPPYTDYETTPVVPALIPRLFPTATFYARVAKIVFASASKAKKGRFDDYEWWRASWSVLRAFEKTGARVSVRGTENLARIDQPCVIIGNHMSTAETFLLASAIRPHMQATFVVKQSLVDYPVFKHVMRSRDPIVVGRVNPREDLKTVINGGKERLQNGISLVIFPQKTRTVHFNREEFNTIGVKLAKRAGAPVIPLALKTNAWSNGRIFKDYGRFDPSEDVYFEFGEALDPSGDDRAVHLAVIEFIEDRLRTLGL